MLEGQIIQEMAGYMQQVGGAYTAWYVGVAEDARRRLFIEHGVNERTDRYVDRQADSAAAARRIEQYFLALGAKGGPGGGTSATTQVYAYLKNAHTAP
jgi:hypothetical protein